MIGGTGEASRIACMPDYSHLKLLPYGGIAARIECNVPWQLELQNNNNNNKTGLLKEGKAFCFLSLPVHTGLPIHVNGYFELSSNVSCRIFSFFFFFFIFFVFCYQRVFVCTCLIFFFVKHGFFTF